MNMQQHILAALREQFGEWKTFIADLNESAITAPRFDLDWSVQDVMAHLWAWQQISIARLQAAVNESEPEFPEWLAARHDEWEGNANLTNALIYETFHARPWGDVYQMWSDGFEKLLELGGMISQRDLLDGDRYRWLNGYSLAAILIASYDHHQEHYEKLVAALEKIS